jgi:hypothetical protein
MSHGVEQSLRHAFGSDSAYLVTGAGFSFGAVNVDGEVLPSTRRLTELFYSTYQTGVLAADASLGDVFDLARLRNADAVDEIIRRKLRVAASADPPDGITTYLSLPWTRIYTFNLDDMVEVAAVQAGRTITCASALRSVPTKGIDYVHLNGDVDDGIQATFSERQYAERMARRDPWLLTLAAELLSGTVVYVGSTLRELHLWSAIEARRMESSVALDPRAPSYLVSPSIDPTRREMLAYSRVHWIQVNTGQFAATVLAPIAAKIPAQARDAVPTEFRWWKLVEPDLQEDAADSRYLLGQQPTWSDVQFVAVSREFESSLAPGQDDGVIVISGTPGSGKTTTAMKMALARRASGRRVRFLDVEDIDAYKDVVGRIRKTAEPYDLIVDNAELLGTWLPSIVNSYLETQAQGRVVVVAPKERLSALRLDQVHAASRIVDVPLLEPSDVTGLLMILGRYGMLGHLETKTAAERAEEMSSRSGRQLLVAMIRATRGEEHETRVAREYESLGPEDRVVYGLISLARDLRYRLKQSELLLAVGKEGLGPLERLLEAGTVLRRDGLVQPRHARIAEIVVATMKSKGELLQAWTLLTQGLAVGHDIANRHARVTRAITRLIGHDEVRRYLGVDKGRLFYAGVRDHLRVDYHYWLHRGSFEVGTHDGLPAARKFLESSRSLAGGDQFVEVAWGDLLFAEARATSPAERTKMAEAAFTHVSGLFDGFGIDNAYPFGVAAKGCIAVATSANLPPRDKAMWLRRGLDDVLGQGLRLHPQETMLKDLRRQVLRASAQQRPRQQGKRPRPT